MVGRLLEGFIKRGWIIMKLLSIVMPYYNRRQLLINTLKSINYYKGDYPIEVIIVDDGSDTEHNINDIDTLFPNLNFNIITLQRNGRIHTTPVIAYNTGFNAVKGDMVLINCAECLHVGNIIKFIYDFLAPQQYISFSAYMSDVDLNRECGVIDWETGDSSLNNVRSKIRLSSHSYWGCHSSIGNFIPYCAVINRKDLETLSGYDERFIVGIGYDDYDFTDRIDNLGVKSIAIDDPFVIHQYHAPTKYPDTKNLDFLLSLRKESPKRIKAENNVIYIK